ncbi:hypothetical protein K435DRAFT_843182 [Dendrothele bispora CBS 962.96]|uniref:Uncharacterized protein n=1 Tax=Dendrothele bispora (strain CBS 962.96) TaxID=1314807 RepID=A0A4S8LA45_DENBC|nr:hypothetical protein K435DRAFT_843182 [Dendrothele bispora CBS 962.96]
MSTHEHKSSSSMSTTNKNTVVVPALKFTYRWSYILLYVVFLIVCNVLIPCLLFYLLQTFTPITTKELIGIGSAALGLSSCFDAPFRLFRLTRHRPDFGPIGTDVWWHLDFVMWSYTFALLVFAFPLAIAPAIAFYNFFLMSTMMLVGPIGVVFLFSLIAGHYQYRLPVRCSSEPIGTVMKPAAFYCLEDVPAVDFKLGRDFRRCVYGRYDASPPFRQLMLDLTVYWVLMSAVYCGITAAVTWAAPLNFAFGWVLGQLFMWAFVSAVGCYFLSKRGLRREEAWWAQRGTTLVKGSLSESNSNEKTTTTKAPNIIISPPTGNGEEDLDRVDGSERSGSTLIDQERVDQEKVREGEKNTKNDRDERAMTNNDHSLDEKRD